jgi:hypothetical protein
LANPGGINQVNRIAGPTPIKQQGELTREAPMSGAALPGRALNSPRRNQRNATGQDAPAQEAGAAAAMIPPPAPPTDYHAQLAAIWNQLAAHSEASELVREYAARAQP